MPFAPERIVCLQPSATVILAGLGQLERVAACTKYCEDVCPQVRATIVADSWTAQSSEILSANPDLVIAAVPYQEKSVAEILKAGVRFLGLAPKNLSDVYKDIAAIAGLVGASEQGDVMIAKMRQQIDSVRVRARNAVRPKVFCEEWGKPLIASQSWVAELVEAAGGDFVAEPGKSIATDKVLQHNPDILIAAWCGAGDRVPLEKIVRERRWEQLRAVRDSRVYCISDELLNTPAPTLLKGLDALASAIHPELFPVPAGLRKIGQKKELPTTS
jgi:iron complex transport system substrate-binding protein